MIQFSQKDIAINNLKFRTETFGETSDPAYILIAGKRCTARFWTDNFCRDLANQSFFVIRYDHRDVGESCEIDWQKTPYTMSDLAKDTTLILDSYGIQKAHFIGNSMGGWICQIVGVDYPDRVLSLVIISAGPIEITEEMAKPTTKEEQEILDSTSKIFSAIKPGKTLQETIQNYIPVWRHLNGKIPLDEEMAKDFTRDFLTRTKHNNTGKNHELMMNKFLATMEKSHTLQKINSPTLVIHGDKDPVVLPRHGKSVADAIPESIFVMIKDMGHTIFNRPLEEKIAKLVVEHFKNYH